MSTSSSLPTSSSSSWLLLERWIRGATSSFLASSLLSLHSRFCWALNAAISFSTWDEQREPLLGQFCVLQYLLHSLSPFCAPSCFPPLPFSTVVVAWWWTHPQLCTHSTSASSSCGCQGKRELVVCKDKKITTPALVLILVSVIVFKTNVSTVPSILDLIKDLF